MKSVYIKTFGCQMNEYDSDKIADVLSRSHDLQRVGEPEAADVLLLNTCSIREKAQEKVFSQLGRWKKLKNNNPDLMIGVGGCVASQEGAAIVDRAPYVDLVFGPQTLHRVPALIEERRRTGKPVVDISFPEIEKFDHLPKPRAEGPTAFVSIMEGCSKYCAFCVVPYTRGEEFSRPFNEVINEIVQLAEQGVREVNLLGQNVNAYRAKTADGVEIDLGSLIYYVAAIEGIDRIRFTTSHPLEFSDSLIQAYAEIPKLANFLHLPVQSGSNRILELMKRNHKHELYREKIAKLRAVRPDIAISSDFIVGFPGETNDDFNNTMQLIKDIAFDQSFSFIFSPRPGTPAANMPDDTPMAVKKERLQTLQSTINHQAQTISEAMIGTTQTVLVEKRSRKDDQQITGRTENMRWVNFDGDERLIGQFVDVQITEALPNSLRGRLIGLADHPILRVA
ncbi:MAG: tRNA (N6-isopentenyl adenosine(37)-C2)-methylthiotransferase MiaB [Gammaproteobacteria bacterium]|nr:tRNA (N6-isopentenyl adenosine(37)-C2)-methylthiotransferase MiaB [Gammaproteobacteria bacterium]